MRSMVAKVMLRIPRPLVCRMEIARRSDQHGFACEHVINRSGAQNTYKCLKASAFHRFLTSRFSDAGRDWSDIGKTKAPSRSYPSAGSPGWTTVANVIWTVSLSEIFTLPESRAVAFPFPLGPNPAAGPADGVGREQPPKAAPASRPGRKSVSARSTSSASTRKARLFPAVRIAASMTVQHARRAGARRDVKAPWMNEQLTVRFPRAAQPLNRGGARKCYCRGTVTLNPGV